MTPPVALHVPDGFLSGGVSAVLWALAIGAIAYSLYRAEDELTEDKVPMLGVLAAFIFAVQMLNFPVAGGTSGHLLGGALAAVLVGPWVGSLCIAVVLVVQALLFADGGLSAVGLNVLNIVIVGAFAGSMAWWVSLTAIAFAVRRHLSLSYVVVLNVILGLIVVGFGIASLLTVAGVQL